MSLDCARRLCGDDAAYESPEGASERPGRSSGEARLSAQVIANGVQAAADLPDGGPQSVFRDFEFFTPVLQLLVIAHVDVHLFGGADQLSRFAPAFRAPVYRDRHFGFPAVAVFASALHLRTSMVPGGRAGTRFPGCFQGRYPYESIMPTGSRRSANGDRANLASGPVRQKHS